MDKVRKLNASIGSPRVAVSLDRLTAIPDSIVRLPLSRAISRALRRMS